MKVKRYTAPTITQAMRLVRQELGREAVILATSRLPDGGVEISAAVEEPTPGDTTAVQEPIAPAEPGGEGSDPRAAIAALARRVEGLGRMLSRHLMVSEAAVGFAARPEVAPLYHHFLRQEVDPDVIVRLLDGLSAPGGTGLLPRLSIRLKKMLRVDRPFRPDPAGAVVWALVGPTGVGKTTTVAKLAAGFALGQGVKVGLVTVDTYRMAAAEQLKVYGRIMEVPVAVASSPAELSEAVEELGDRELILVDTVGRAPRDEDSLEELAAVLAGVRGIRCHLVLAAPTREADQEEVLAAFARFRPVSLVFTKLDETATYGPILNRVVRSGLPVSWLGTGQRVPEDIEPATRQGLARRLLPARRDLENFAD
jgi:flagellar biosynthesis protein FlhF